MVVIGNYRNRAELRKKPRRHFRYNAKIIAKGSGPPRSCTISDISHSGARLVLESDGTLPDRFFLLLSRSGVRRRCRMIWRTGLTVGVEFATG